MRFKHMLSGIAAAAMLAVPIVQPGNLPLGATTVQAREANVSINIFFDALSEDGEWIDYAPYGYVWAPSDVPADWAPYTRGHWAYTERYGWTFVSDEPFAWAVYHYGRWGYDQDIGWFWVPGTVWAPAWVSWRRSDEVVGWAPLPPEDEGYAVSAEVSYAEPPRHYWHFVPAPEFLAPDLAVVIVHDEAPFDETEDVGPVVVHNNIVVNNRIDVRYVEQVTRRQVQVTKVQVVNDPMRAERPAAKRGAIVAVERRLAKPPKDVAPRKVIEAKAVKAPTKGQKVEASAGARPGKNVAEPGAGQATAGAGQPAVKTPGAKANGKAEEKTAKAVIGKESQPTPPDEKVKPPQKAANGKAGQQVGEVSKRKPGKGITQPEVQAGPAAAAKSAQAKQAQAKEAKVKQAQAKQVQAAREKAARTLAQKKLKKQPGAVARVQGAPNRNTVAKAAPKHERQIAAKAAPKARAAAAGPRKLKQVAQRPSPERTGAIARGKAAPQVRAHAPGPKVAGAKPRGKPKACNAALHAAGKC